MHAVVSHHIDIDISPYLPFKRALRLFHTEEPDGKSNTTKQKVKIILIRETKYLLKMPTRVLLIKTNSATIKQVKQTAYMP